jgi:hypothetical protein
MHINEYLKTYNKLFVNFIKSIEAEEPAATETPTLEAIEKLDSELADKVRSGEASLAEAFNTATFNVMAWELINKAAKTNIPCVSPEMMEQLHAVAKKTSSHILMIIPQGVDLDAIGDVDVAKFIDDVLREELAEHDMAE